MDPLHKPVPYLRAPFSSFTVLPSPSGERTLHVSGLSYWPSLGNQSQCLVWFWWRYGGFHSENRKILWWNHIFIPWEAGTLRRGKWFFLGARGWGPEGQMGLTTSGNCLNWTWWGHSRKYVLEFTSALMISKWAPILPQLQAPTFKLSASRYGFSSFLPLSLCFTFIDFSLPSFPYLSLFFMLILSLFGIFSSLFPYHWLYMLLRPQHISPEWLSLSFLLKTFFLHLPTCHSYPFILLCTVFFITYATTGKVIEFVCFDCVCFSPTTM